MKVVLDTNIWVSAIIWGGLSEKLIELSKSHKITIVITNELLQELENTLNKNKFKNYLTQMNLKSSEIIDLVQELVDVYPCNLLNVTQTILDSKNSWGKMLEQLRDPNDAIVILAAIATEAEIIITGDKDLLILNQISDIPILNVRDFLNLLN